MTQMNYIKFKLCVILLLGLGLSALKAQEAIPSSGGKAIGTAGTVSYSIGQLVYTTVDGTNGSVSQGVQQPYEISVITSTVESESLNLNLSVSPNPAPDVLILKIDGTVSKSYTASLFDMNGKLMVKKQIESNETHIDMSKFIISAYVLKITENIPAGKSQPTALYPEIKSFKIIKN